MTFADPTATDLEQSRTRILEVAERYFRRIGYHKTSVADIAAELGMSRANIYRFFPSRTAINSSVCGLVVKEVAEIALAIAQTDAPASKKLADLLTAIHGHSARRLVEDRPMHQLLVAAADGSWATINAHNEQILAILKALVREGVQTGEFKVEDADEAARGIITAFLPFFHPVLVEQRVQEGEATAVSVHAQIRFILTALGTSDRATSPKGISA
ncbi:MULTISPECIES: TetR family transcriptional regulator [unclassified Rhizobium]|uniref:TetR/AcrR family transcriptional regulator n=1 Tax=unclassified Rhizobium TaxID=2613769 RepID=UPI001A9A197A|nr:MULTISPECIES: TetR family transcriptional regulator [unclassified Rhizobium]MBX5156967.1 TetR family transcriptional regulator [Rhizobium sp. NZLR8]MBX5197600.1 TetR family transcriptional regulator [Rhizobium sp. NZLR10]MBX5204362.1 TetR family transcriptional regulator [Rhizobium sp. NZLR1]QSZ22072.1 TetR family transcriptional regulator [Rhizobium sp. NZLR1]